MNWTITQIASVVLCAVGSGMIFSSFGHTPILGYIIAGILLGPSCLKFIADRAVVEVFAEMGILFLLFTIGLGLSFEKVKNIWKTSLTATLLSAILIYALVIAAGNFLDLSHTRVVLITFCVTLSSTAVTVKSLENLKERDESIESSSFGILIAQDLVSLLMVLIINFLGASAEIDYQSQRIVAVLLFAIGLIFYFSKYHRYIHRVTDFINKHENMLALIIFGFCLGFAVFTEVVGLSAPFGAFIAGLILGNSNMRDKVKSISSPIEEILLMTFFLSVGLLVDLIFVWNNFLLILTSLVFVTLGKTVINIFVLRFCRFPLKESFVISVLLANIGEFSFMLTYAANKIGLVNEYGIKFLVSLTALSLLLSPFWLIFAERCRTLAESANVISSWEFFQLVGGREIGEVRHFVDIAVHFCKRSFGAAFEKAQKVFKRIKNKTPK
ncbi:MAG: cation:proton antiporter [Holosporaceae bacterium]|jgi:CPA2 family monovalent cation:H+ antiporter-2|nr:cation:proton antiporter [Holosporaceae bacterium]